MSIWRRVILIALLTILVQLQSDKCEELVTAWATNPKSLPPIVYADSGKFLNDLGDYNNCQFNR